MEKYVEEYRTACNCIFELGLASKLVNEFFKEFFSHNFFLQADDLKYSACLHYCSVMGPTDYHHLVFEQILSEHFIACPFSHLPFSKCTSISLQQILLSAFNVAWCSNGFSSYSNHCKFHC